MRWSCADSVCIGCFVLRAGTIGMNGKMLMIETILVTSRVDGSAVLVAGNTGKVALYVVADLDNDVSRAESSLP